MSGTQGRGKELKSLQTINAGDGVEKRELSHTVGRNVNCYNDYGEQHGRPLHSESRTTM